MKDNLPRSRPLICLFDSGIGGLQLLKACVRRMPQADFCYFADNYNMPYGNLGENKIFSLVDGVFEKIARMHPAVAAVACNTVTAHCIAKLRAKYEFPVIGMEPALKQAHAAGGRYLVLATRATCGSRAFASLMARYGNGAEVFPCDGLASEIEASAPEIPGRRLAEGLPHGNYNSVVLGCTHYVFIEQEVKERYRCPVFDGISGTADHIHSMIGNFDHQSTNNQKIDFISGNFTKNRLIFGRIMQF